MADSDDLAAQIETNAQAPRRAQGDSGSVEQHSLPDQIAAAKFKLNNAAVKSGVGFRRVKMRPGGNSDVEFCR